MATKRKVGDVSGPEAVKAVTRKARRTVQKPAAVSMAYLIDTYGRPGEWTAGPLGLPESCPVSALGKSGDDFFFLDATHDFRVVRDREFSLNKLSSLFAPKADYATWAWPRLSAHGTITGTQGDVAYRRLMDACSLRGYFDPMEQMRGRGGWLGEDGALIFFDGEYVWTHRGKTDIEPLQQLDHQNFIYPRRPKIHEPWDMPVTDDINPAPGLIAEFDRWNWERPGIDAILLLGWLVASFLGAALHFRTILFITGNAATGKTTLLQTIKSIHGRGIIKVEDTTPAGIYQSVKFDSLPVGIDEIEADEDTERARAVIKIARIAATGGKLMRGSSDAKSMEFIARNAFMFSAIMRPPVPPQDLSRMVTLRLKPHEQKPGSGKGELFSVNINVDTVAPLLIRRAFDQWHRFQATIQEYRRALAVGGHAGRGQDAYATLLACADLVLSPELCEEHDIPLCQQDARDWSQWLAVDNLPDNDKPVQPWVKCLNHLFTTQVAAWRSGERQTVAQVVDAMLGGQDEELIKWEDGQKLLAATGLRLEKIGSKHPHSAVLCVPNEHSSLWRLFEKTAWAGPNMVCAWSETLRRAPDDVIMFSDPADAQQEEKNRNFNVIKVAGAAKRCALIVVSEAMASLKG